MFFQQFMGCNGELAYLKRISYLNLTFDSYDLLRPDYLWTARPRWEHNLPPRDWRVWHCQLPEHSTGAFLH